MTYSTFCGYSDRLLNVWNVCKYVCVFKSVCVSYSAENWMHGAPCMLIKLWQEQVKCINYFLSIKLCGKTVVYHFYLETDCICTAEHNFLHRTNKFNNLVILLDAESAVAKQMMDKLIQFKEVIS
jgi:hypothetical protein